PLSLEHHREDARRLARPDAADHGAACARCPARVVDAALHIRGVRAPMPRKSSSTHAIRLSGLKEALAAVAALPEMTRVRVLDATRQAAYRTAQRAPTACAAGTRRQCARIEGRAPGHHDAVRAPRALRHTAVAGRAVHDDRR